MKTRLNPYEASRESVEAMLALSNHVKKSGLEPSLTHLVLTRASQINGCANCLHMHTKDALADGESAARLFLLNAWRESLLYSPRERAALAWTEALTLISETHAPDAVYDEARRHFTEEELVKLTLLIGVINTWNRIAIGFRVVHPADHENARAEAA
jgi:AhpD family alkylhydroperoxidase